MLKESELEENGAIDKTLFVDPDRYNYEYPYFVENISNISTGDQYDGIDLFTGSKQIFTEDRWDKLKTLFIVQNLSLPMTVLSMGIFMEIDDRSRG